MSLNACETGSPIEATQTLPTSVDAAQTPIPTVADPLQAKLTPRILEVRPNGDWSAVVEIEASGGRPPYAFESAWPAAGPSSLTVTGAHCEPVQFSAVAKSADGQRYPVSLRFGPTSCTVTTGTSQPTSALTPILPDSTGLLARISDLRAQANLPPFTLNDQLTQAAARHAQDMARTGSLGHAGSDGSTAARRILDAGYAATATGEIIYAGASLDEAWAFWTGDAAHRSILLGQQYADIGIGIVQTGSQAYIAVTFAAP